MAPPARRRPSCRSRSSATTARGCTSTSRSGTRANRCSSTSPVRRPLGHRALVHRRPAPARPVAVGLHQPDGELLPPTGARLRGPDQPGVQPAQPLGLRADPDHGPEPEGQANRVPLPGPLGQPLSRVRGAAAGGPRRDQEQDRAARPVDKDIYELPPDEMAEIDQVPTSLNAVLDNLERDHEFLPQGGVFTPDLIETWIEYKRTWRSSRAAAAAPARVRALLRHLSSHRCTCGPGRVEAIRKQPLTWEDTDSPPPSGQGPLLVKCIPRAALARPQQACLESDVGDLFELALVRPSGEAAGPRDAAESAATPLRPRATTFDPYPYRWNRHDWRNGA